MSKSTDVRISMFVCECKSMTQIFLFTFTQMNLLRGKLHVCFLIPFSLKIHFFFFILVPFFFCIADFYRAQALKLYYVAYLLRPCVYIQGSASFLLTLEAELVSKMTASQASATVQTTGLSKYLPAPTFVCSRSQSKCRPNNEETAALNQSQTNRT